MRVDFIPGKENGASKPKPQLPRDTVPFMPDDKLLSSQLPTPTITTTSTPTSIASARPKLLPLIDEGDKGMSEAQRKSAPAVKASGDSISIQVGLAELVRLIGAILLVGGAWWSLRSDLRDIRTNQEWQTKVQEDRWKAQQEGMSNFSRQWQLQQYDIGEIKLALAKAGIYTTKKAE